MTVTFSFFFFFSEVLTTSFYSLTTSKYVCCRLNKFVERKLAGFSTFYDCKGGNKPCFISLHVVIKQRENFKKRVLNAESGISG